MLRVLAAAILLAAVSSPAAAADRALPQPPAELARVARLVQIASGLTRPVGLVFAPRDPESRLFVVEQVGRIRVLKDGRVDPTPVLDMVGKVSRDNEQGLLGLAFHPKFADNRRLYINYTDRAGDTHVVELRTAKDPPLHVDGASARELLFVKQPYSNHNGGDLVFGPDGKLYVGLGDGGFHGDPHGNGQRPDTPLAKMLRIDVDAPAPKPEIVARGLRNPWRYTFDRKTGDLYIADVGQDKWEEVDVVPTGTLDGRNFGWNYMEALHCFRGSFCRRADFTLPVVEYSHGVGCSITGGYVYRGKALPELDGIYFYTDFCTAIVRSFRYRDLRATDEWDWKRAFDPESKLAQISTFGEDEAGELYIVSLDGVIYKLVRQAH
jgi:glucose/arabinose dehydrogenase